MSKVDEKNPYLVPALQRGLQILRMFRRDRQVLGAPEIAAELGIPRTTVFRLLQTLEHMGYIRRANGDRDYRLGVAVLTLGFEFLASQEINELARPILERLRDRTGFATHLVAREERDVVYLLRIPGYSVLNTSIVVGTRLPAHATIMGRVLLSDLTDDELDALYAGQTLSARSPQTPTTIEALKALLREDRKRGYVISESFYERGINAIAAPVRDASGRVVAVINLIARDGEAGSDQLGGELLRHVLDAAEEISASLDYQPGDGS